MNKVFFFKSSFDKYDGDIGKALNKVVREKSSEKAKWIDNAIKSLLPKWVVKNVEKHQKNRLFRYLVRNIYKIEISMIDGLIGDRKTIEIKKNGKVKYKRTFYD